MTISGLDECGRGSLAGPLVAAIASINIDIDEFLNLLNTPLRDSKKLTKIQRNKIYDIRDTLPISYAIEEIQVAEIDEYGIQWANKEIFTRLFTKLNSDKYLVDGNINFQDPRVESVIKGDDIHPQIMLASVIAKVHRDNLMESLHEEFPMYGWDSNAGYGATFHTDAIRNYGPSPYHRSLFIRNFIDAI